MVAANGVYGERMASMLERANRSPVVVQSPWQESIDFQAIEARLQSDSMIEHVIAVHHETTTGRINDLNLLAEICFRHKRRMLLDTVSSFGAEEINLSDWPVPLKT